jgi:hypothetical protein
MMITFSYFSYGSNMSKVQMSKRFPISTKVGLVTLSGDEFIINERDSVGVIEKQDTSIIGLL